MMSSLGIFGACTAQLQLRSAHYGLTALGECPYQAHHPHHISSIYGHVKLYVCLANVPQHVNDRYVACQGHEGHATTLLLAWLLGCLFA